MINPPADLQRKLAVYMNSRGSSMMQRSIPSPPNALEANERVGSLVPANPQDWDLTSIAVELGFRNRSQLGAALGAINTRGYRVFALTDDRRRRRVIHAPHQWLKTIQRRAYEGILSRLPVSDAVYSRAGRGVVKNAEQHIGRAYLTIVDVAACFPSTTIEMVVNSLLILAVPGEVAGALTRLGTYHGFLPQGPPTSPAILDLVFGPIDNMLRELAEVRGAIYTRYMDDLAFSADRPLAGLDREVIGVLRELGYESKPSKLRVWGRADQHTVTKIVVDTTLNPMTDFLEDLTVHLRQLEAGNCQWSDAKLRGKINWVSNLNPALGRRLKAQRNRLASKVQPGRLFPKGLKVDNHRN